MNHLSARWVLALVSFGALSTAAACAPPPPPAPPVAPAPAEPTASAPPAPAPPPPLPVDPPAEVVKLPTLTAERFGSADAPPRGLFILENALVVAEDQRLGTIHGDRIQWRPPVLDKGNPAAGPNVINEVGGHWPDRVDIRFSSANPRWASPTFTSMGSKKYYTADGGGGGGFIAGSATTGKSTVVGIYATQSVSAPEPGWRDGGGVVGMNYLTARGPKLERKSILLAGSDCADAKEDFNKSRPGLSALSPMLLTSTPAGTMMLLGPQCDSRGMGLEIWDAAGKSRIVSLAPLWKHMEGNRDEIQIRKAEGDELWIRPSAWTPVLHYKDGKVTRASERPFYADSLYLVNGVPHASDGRVIHRLEGGAWKPVYRLAKPMRFDVLAADAGKLWGLSDGVLYKLVEGPAADASLACPTPFVFLGEAARSDEPPFVETKKALESFPWAGAVTLKHFEGGYFRFLGVQVPSRAAGEALIAHLQGKTDKVDPRLVCFSPAKLVDESADAPAQ